MRQNKKDKKETFWPAEDLVNQFVKSGPKYNFKSFDERKKSRQHSSLEESDDGETDYFKTSDSSVTLKNMKKATNMEISKDYMKMAPKKLDQLYQLPIGESKASERVHLYQ